MRALLILAALTAFVAAPAAAAEHGGEGAKAEPVGQYVDVSPVALPVIYQGRLINYVFVQVRVNLANNANATAVREKEPYLRDALVRLGHRRPFTRLDDFTSLDANALRAAFTPEAVRVVGPRQVTGVQILSQAAKQRSGLPRPPQMRAAPPQPTPAH